MATRKIKGTEEAWEARTLGASDAHAAVADEAHENALDAALEMQSISIRLPKKMIDQYKLIAQFHGVGYQPLMRDVLHRFVPTALREIASEAEKAQKASASSLTPSERKAA